MWPFDRKRPKKVDGTDFDPDDAIAHAQAIRRSMDEAMGQMRLSLRRSREEMRAMREASLARRIAIVSNPFRRATPVAESSIPDDLWATLTVPSIRETQSSRTVTVGGAVVGGLCWSIFTLQWPQIWIAAVIGRE